MNKVADEIDLFELLTKGVLVIKRNFLALVIAIVIGWGLGFGYYKTTPVVFESEMIITSDILTESYSKSAFVNIQKLVGENNTAALSSTLNISETQAAAITNIKTDVELEGIIGRLGLPEQSKTYINITVKSLDNAIWSDLQKGIAAFIENNDFVKIRVAQKKKYLTSLITKIDHELNDLEIMKSKIMEGKLSSNAETTINSEIIELNKEKIDFQNKLELVNSVQVVESFTAFKNPVGPKLSIHLLSGALLGLFSFTVFIGLKFIRKLVRAEENKKEA